MNYKIPRGTFDILPADSYKWQHVQNVFRAVAHSYGYSEITTPIFEMSEVFERSSGESSDVVQKEMYRFTDQKGRTFALRPEGTAPVVRSYVENHLDVLNPKSKLYYMGPMFRYDRPQAGRYRQFYQYGIEFIGSDNPFYDAEVIAIEISFLSALGLRNFRTEINSVGCADCAKSYEAALKEYYAPHLDKLCPDCQKRYHVKPRRLLDCKVPSCKVFKGDAPSQFEYLDQPCRAHFDEVCSYLDRMGIAYQINPSIVRGLDYYTNTAFEIIYDDLGAQNSIAGGGRYNSLIEQIGGKATPAIGFAGGFERLLLALEKEGIALPGMPSPDAYLIVMGAIDFALPILHSLRENGLYVEYNADKGSFKAQLKAADSSKARFAIIIGEDEAKKGTVVVKDLTLGSQVTVAPSEVLAILSAK